jgi:hypothetical protein
MKSDPARQCPGASQLATDAELHSAGVRPSTLPRHARKSPSPPSPSAGRRHRPRQSGEIRDTLVGLALFRGSCPADALVFRKPLRTTASRGGRCGFDGLGGASSPRDGYAAPAAREDLALRRPSCQQRRRPRALWPHPRRSFGAFSGTRSARDGCTCRRCTGCHPRRPRSRTAARAERRPPARRLPPYPNPRTDRRRS